MHALPSLTLGENLCRKRKLSLAVSLSTHISVPAMIIQEWSLQQESGAQELILSLLPSPTFCLWAGPVGTWLLPLVFTGGRWPGPGFSLMWFLPERTPRWGWLCLSLCLHLPASEATPRPGWLRLWMESKHLSTDRSEILHKEFPCVDSCIE